MQKVFLALSGGVDSAVSAALLKEKGYEVVGVFMKNWSGDDYGIQADCPWEVDQADAEAVCKHLGIEFRSVNFEKEYRDRVVSYFFEEYSKGRTPNPDVMCNKEIKFKLFLEKAIELGFDLIATGHYAQVNPDTDQEGNIIYKLTRGLDKNKDQSYFIYNLGQSELSKTLFPIGNFQKSEVRELAKKFDLPNAAKPDSQGICFIGEINVLKFLMSKLPLNTGAIVDFDSGKTVGEHKGSYFYTIGQREGLGIGGQAVPYFVVDKDFEKNIVYVGHGHDHPKLFSDKIHLENIHFAIPSNLEQFNKDREFKCKASIRYRQEPQKGRLVMEENKLCFQFDQPQRAVASGQSLVLYQGEECLGGGVIL